MKLDSGHEATPLEGEELAQQERDFLGHRNGLVRLTPGRWLLPGSFIKISDKIYNFKWRSSDVVVMTYSKCGTTWMQEIIWTMRNNPNLDHPYANDPVMDRAPFLEGDMMIPKDMVWNEEMLKETPSFQRWCKGADPKDGIYLQISAATPDPRTIKTHLPFSLFHPLLLDTVKVVYVIRNPKDVFLSFLHHLRLIYIHHYVGTTEGFMKYFTNGNALYGPYDEHLKEAWERRGHPNLHIVFYEDLKADPVKELRRLNDFLGTSLSEQQLTKIAEYTSFGQMKARNNGPLKTIYNQEVLNKEGGFYRKGISGDWKKSLPEHLIVEMDSWIKKNFNFGVTFK